jgi:hypothetical protein
MREILFRGKLADNGYWIFGSLFTRINERYIIPLPIVTSKCLVDPATVGQFTGLTDKNGKKIFEGDIIENIDGRAIVFFDKTPCGFYMRFLDAYDDTPLDMGEMWDETEVIGNIHDNPELLEVTE